MSYPSYGSISSSSSSNSISSLDSSNSISKSNTYDSPLKDFNAISIFLKNAIKEIVQKIDIDPDTKKKIYKITLENSKNFTCVNDYFTVGTPCFGNDYAIKVNAFIQIHIRIYLHFHNKNEQEKKKLQAFHFVDLPGNFHILARYKEIDLLEAVDFTNAKCLGSKDDITIYRVTSFSGRNLVFINTTKKVDDATNKVMKEFSIYEKLNKNGTQMGIIKPIELYNSPNFAPLEGSVCGYFRKFYNGILYYLLISSEYQENSFIKSSLIQAAYQLLFANDYATKLGIINNHLHPKNIAFVSTENREDHYKWFIIDWKNALELETLKEKWENKMELEFHKEYYSTLNKNYISFTDYKILTETNNLSFEEYCKILDKINTCSLAMVIYYIICKKHPFNLVYEYFNSSLCTFAGLENRKYTYKNISLNFDADALKKAGFNKNFIYWMISMLNPDIKERYTAKEALQNFLMLEEVKENLNKYSYTNTKKNSFAFFKSKK